MELWMAWNACVEGLRPACSRQATFAWMRIVLMGLCVRADLAGVTSLVRALALRPDRYLRLLALLHSEALRLGVLTALWVRFCRTRFSPVQVGGAWVCLADGLKVLKEGRKMPAVTLAHALGRDLGVFSRIYASWCEILLGCPDQGLATSQEAVALARRVEHPLSVAATLARAAATHRLRREPGPAPERADEAIALAEELGFPIYVGVARALRGWARAVAQAGGEAVAEIQQGLAELARIRAFVAPTSLNVALAEAFWKVERHDDALGALDLGVARAQETGALHWHAELHRLRAEILLDQDGGPPEEAEDLLRRALEIAREQEAKWFELRAATSLARLLHDQGRRDEARALLRPLYAWFTEGFDTADLKDAKALLDELGP
jgi:tetratricopeptide (TPR) repeat protein